MTPRQRPSLILLFFFFASHNAVRKQASTETQGERLTRNYCFLVHVPAPFMQGEKNKQERRLHPHAAHDTQRCNSNINFPLSKKEINSKSLSLSTSSFSLLSHQYKASFHFPARSFNSLAKFSFASFLTSNSLLL